MKTVQEVKAIHQNNIQKHYEKEYRRFGSMIENFGDDQIKIDNKEWSIKYRDEVRRMLDDKEFVATHLLFIDADIGFSWHNIERLLCADKDIACGVYPRKHIYLEKIKGILEENPNAYPDEIEAKALGYNINFDQPDFLKGENGFFRVNEAATGMMLVKRSVFRTMFKKFPERKYVSDQIVNGKNYRSDNCYDLFAVGPYQTLDQKRYLSEDYYFSRLWTEECGGEIWADLAMPLTHFGNRAYKGHVGSLIAKKNDNK